MTVVDMMFLVVPAVAAELVVSMINQTFAVVVNTAGLIVVVAGIARPNAVFSPFPSNKRNAQYVFSYREMF